MSSFSTTHSSVSVCRIPATIPTSCSYSSSRSQVVDPALVRDGRHLYPDSLLCSAIHDPSSGIELHAAC